MQIKVKARLGGPWIAEDWPRSSRSEPYALRRIPLDERTAEQPIEVFPLADRQWRQRGFEDRADEVAALAERCLATRGEPVTVRPPWSGHALDHSELEKAVGQRAEGLVGLKRHLGECVRRRVRACADRAQSVPLGDFYSLTPRQVAEHSYHDPDRFGIDPSKLSPEALKMMAGNRAALAVYSGTSMKDAGLNQRLAGVSKPTLVVWGDSDRIADPDYGRAFADAIPGARFQLLRDTGHLPQIEMPGQLLDVVWAFAESHAIMRPDQLSRGLEIPYSPRSL